MNSSSNTGSHYEAYVNYVNNGNAILHLSNFGNLRSPRDLALNVGTGVGIFNNNDS